MISGVNSMFSNMDTSLMQEMRENRFAKMDANGDGKVDKNELSTFLNDIAKKTGKFMDVDKIFAEVDTNNDGYISKDEDAAQEAKMQQMHGGPRESPFAKMDANGDGKVDKAEMSAFFDEMTQETGNSINVDELFASIDTNNDGFISKEENDAYEAQLKSQMESRMSSEMSLAGVNSSNNSQSLLDLLSSKSDDNNSQTWIEQILQLRLEQLYSANSGELNQSSQSTIDIQA
jgi:Ca2+-binding EF-hand superfamily protein